MDEVVRGRRGVHTAAGVLRTLVVLALLFGAAFLAAGAFFAAAVFLGAAFLTAVFLVAAAFGLATLGLAAAVVAFLAAGLALAELLGAASFTGPDAPVKGGEVSTEVRGDDVNCEFGR